MTEGFEMLSCTAHCNCVQQWMPAIKAVTKHVCKNGVMVERCCGLAVHEP